MKKEEFLAMSFPFGLKVDIIYNFSSPSKSTNLIGQDLDKENEYEVIPYCHPLSDITKPIEHNGEKFVPIEKIAYSYGYEIRISRNKLLQPIMCEQFNVVLQLIEWHFDIAGLIEKGEAIDVNTLPENPYK